MQVAAIGINFKRIKIEIRNNCPEPAKNLDRQEYTCKTISMKLFQLTKEKYPTPNFLRPKRVLPCRSDTDNQGQRQIYIWSSVDTLLIHRVCLSIKFKMEILAVKRYISGKLSRFKNKNNARMHLHVKKHYSAIQYFFILFKPQCQRFHISLSCSSHNVSHLN